MKFMLPALTGLIAFSLFIEASAARLGEIESYDEKSRYVRFFIGDMKIEKGEELKIKNSLGRRDVTIKVLSVEPPYANAEVVRIDLPLGVAFETMHSGRSVALEVDQREIKRAYFFVGPSFSEKVGEFGGTNYGLGLGFNGAFPIWTHHDLSWSLLLQADDLGTDTAGNGKRTGYYMFGLGQVRERWQYFAHIGVVDNMTMPKGGKTVVDPYTGANYPDNVVHTSNFGYLMSIKYYYPIRKVSRNSDSGWGFSPYFSMGGSFNSSGYKNTYTLGACIDMEVLF